MKITNLTQHRASPDQGDVVDLPDEVRDKVIKWLTFEECPSWSDIVATASFLASIAEKQGSLVVMIGGAPYLMAPLEAALVNRGLIPVYAFSKRVTEEALGPDGLVIKRSCFKHQGFVDPTGRYRELIAGMAK